ncbi:all trans-polyprenyl-diphosphate synthase PDSS2 isoform X1 [Lepeophtheirus salmonis]|uniref:all trans-polyprenyl-diphosphate synthase PDSS2 isoform X1 n=2 Tax=Lepeophtheirus salmonis TaxID=72036 RepID=UPI001AE76D20|nr:all trans-polyprenyl-diphosphate synthase PDSS2-like isoform X1 [Lepeophtheirus salmonis]
MIGSSRSIIRTLHISQVHIPKRRGWDRVLSEAEKLVGFPSSFASLSAFMNEDMSNWAVHARKLASSNHPFTTTMKRLVFQGRNSLQVRGLISLLFSRLINDPEHFKNNDDFIKEHGILKVQQQLAETLELIYTAQYIHRSLINLPNDLHSRVDSELKDDLLQLEFGNKIALLGGDYLLAQACMNLALMRSSMIVDIISKSLIDFTQSEFITTRDVSGRHLPKKDQIIYKHWELRSSLSWAGLMANVCRGSCSLGGHSIELQNLGYRFGIHFALAHQAQMEIDVISECPVDGFDLTSLPLVFYFQNNKKLLSNLPIRGNQLIVDEVNWKEISHQILTGDALEKTHEVIEDHSDVCEKELKKLRDDESKNVLLKLIKHLKDV